MDFLVLCPSEIKNTQKASDAQKPFSLKKHKPGKNTKTINPSKYNKNFKIHKKNKTKKKLIFQLFIKLSECKHFLVQRQVKVIFSIWGFETDSFLDGKA